MYLTLKYVRLSNWSVVAAGLLFLVACATPLPVQEMSNARQALQAAEAADAAHFAPQDLRRARRLLDRASTFLEAGEYGQARALAVEARMAAWRAHELAVNHRTR
ncbi:MAG TPA: DUF4398 domain-containing protein [Gammaproteobacteria bacterium]|nr:DUF4398 domain-containing protein [Gammaproteobacteria bacterium]